MLRKKICLFFALLFLNTGVYAGEKIDAKRYVEAKVIERQPPKYPAISARKGQEGWVSLIFTVAADAKIKDIEVVNHSGVEAFVGPAVQAVSKYKYEPAIFEGKPVESVEEFRLTFQFSQTPRVAGKRFASYFRKYKKAILDKNEARASKYLARLREIKADNLYESAFINLSEYYYGVLNGHSDLELIERLREVTKVIGEEPFISKSAWSDAMRHLFTLLVKQNHYGEAVDIYNQIPDKKIYEEVRKDLASVTMQLESLKNDGNAYATEIKLRDTGLYSLKLWKPVFSVEGLKGKITRFRMSCDAGIKGIEFIENVEYQIPKSYGDCTLRIKGEPGSTFSLVQLPVAEPQD